MPIRSAATNVALSFVLSINLIRIVHCGVCTYVNCEPVEDFLASPAPHVIGPHCASCTECAQLNFATCTLVHTKDQETGAHCVCGNTLHYSCKADRIRLVDILDRNATVFDHDYACTFSSEDVTDILPPLEVVNFPVKADSEEATTFRVPVEELGTRRLSDLQFQTISLYMLNQSESNLINEDRGELQYFEPYARIHLGSDGTAVSAEPDDGRVNITEWPTVVLPDLDEVPATIAYASSYPVRRLIVDPKDNNSVVALPVLYSRSTPVLRKAGTGPNYTLVVLIVVGTILAILGACAFVSCKDKLRQRRYQRSVENAVATKDDVELGKSAAVSNHPQSYTVVKNGGHGRGPADQHEKVQLLRTPENRNEDVSTLPMSSSTVGRMSDSFRPKQHPGGQNDSSLARSTSSKTEDTKQRNPAAIEADRKKFLQIVKDATVIKAADLDLLESIGNGEFGIIRRGYVFDRTEAMIHCLRPPHKQTSEAVAESLMERMDASVKAGFHPHIISLLGLCQEGELLYVCLQLETGPNLRNMLRESRSLEKFLQYTNSRGRLSLMSPQRMLNIILGIARGMGHLEESQVLHDNVAAVNIVICDNGTPKIAGFGMATLSDLYMRQMERNHDQLRWLPPETHDTGLFTMKSQTWSFGVVLWEIVTFGATPYYSLTDDEVVNRVAEGYRLHRPSNCSRQLYDLMEQCWRANGEDRPDFTYVQQHVHELNLDPELHISVVYQDGFKYEPIREIWNT